MANKSKASDLIGLGKLPMKRQTGESEEVVGTRQDKILLEMVRLVFRAVWFSETKLIFLVLSVLQDHNNDETAYGSKEAIKCLKTAIDGLDKTLTRCRDVYTKKAKD